MFPSTFSTFTYPNPTQKLNSPSQSSIIGNLSSSLGQVEAVIGKADDSSVLGTIIGDLRSPDSGGGGHVQTAAKGGTGQITYTKGDILVARNASTLSRLAVGSTDGYALIVDSTTNTGVKWGVPASGPTVRVYGGSVLGAGAAGPSAGATSLLSIWQKPSTLSYAVIEIIGGGGGGGAANGNPQRAGGGGAGGYVKKTVLAANLPSAASVVVGLGGASSIAGGTTSFGSIVAAFGGNPGVNNGDAGAGGAPSILGDINSWGGDGAAGIIETADDAAGGHGGGGYFGGGGRGERNGVGQIAKVPGAGGGGGADTADSQKAGGRGGEGMVIIYEY